MNYYVRHSWSLAAYAGGTQWDNVEVLYGLSNASFAASSGTVAAESLLQLQGPATEYGVGQPISAPGVHTELHRMSTAKQVRQPPPSTLACMQAASFTHAASLMQAAWQAAGSPMTVDGCHV